MDLTLTNLLLCICMSLPALILFFHRRRNPSALRLPPGPPGWPVFGNMFDLGSMPHRTIAGLAGPYGPVVWLRLGSMNTMVILTADAATELFRNHDSNFAERTITEVMRAHDFHRAAVSLSPYGPYWRAMKRVMTVEMLVQRRINETTAVRERCVSDMVGWVEGGARAAGSGRVQVGKFVFLASFNMLGNLMLSRDLASPSSESSEFFDAMVYLGEWSGHGNVSDVFPWLRWLDPQGLRRNMEKGMGRTLKIVGEFVAERLREKQLKKTDEVGKKDYLEVLLEFEGSGSNDEPASRISEHDLNIIIMEIFLAGTDTTSSTIEWAMVELLNHPETMKKAQDELSRVVGRGNKFQETHIENLPYLQAVLKETLRLHPPIPFLVPRRAINDTNFMGYDVPKDTQVFVNAWAIGRDPKCWHDPLRFNPDRFLTGPKKGIEYKGHSSFELIPFGAGRRACAGIPLAHRMLHLVLGSLLHEFDWEVDEVCKKGLVDDREKMGVTVRKTVPLEAIPRKVSR